MRKVAITILFVSQASEGKRYLKEQKNFVELNHKYFVSLNDVESESDAAIASRELWRMIRSVSLCHAHYRRTVHLRIGLGPVVAQVSNP